MFFPLPGAMQMRPMPMMMVARRTPLLEIPAGGFPVPEAIKPDQFPPEVRASILRILAGPPKPAVTPAVMNEAQRSMIGPDLPFKSNV